MKIFYIRHGESIQNTYENPKNLPDPLVTLTEKGKMQAHKCGEFLQDYCNEYNIDLNKSLLIVSPFVRTRQTAEIINNYLRIENVKEDTLII